MTEAFLLERLKPHMDERQCKAVFRVQGPDLKSHDAPLEGEEGENNDVNAG